MDAISISYLTMEGVISVLSVIGNFMVLLAIYRDYALQTITNCFVASLALADLLVGLIATPCAVLSFVGLPHNFLGCVFINSVIVLFTTISIFSLVAVAIERFIAISSPFFYQKHMTVHRAIVILVITWILGTSVGLTPVFGWNLGPKEEMVCAFTSVIDMKYMVYLNFMGLYCVPLFIMICIYMYIYVIVRQQLIKIEALEVAVEGRKKKKNFMKEIKAAKSMAIVLGLFMMSWLPINILNSITLLCGPRCAVSVPYAVLLTAILLSHGNSVFNPFLYAYGNSKFKQAFKKMLWFFMRRNVVSTDNVVGNPNVNTLRSNVDQPEERF